MHKTALIIGITGQDGSYLSQLLLSKGYEVFGVSRGSGSRTNGLAVLEIQNQVGLRNFDAQDPEKLGSFIGDIAPTEIYNLGGESSVASSFRDPINVVMSNISITSNCLEYIRRNAPETKYYNSASSECFGDSRGSAADEETPFRPVSPYGTAKACTFSLTKNYREAYGLFACSGILFNHESRLRGNEFVSQKIVTAARLIAEKQLTKLEMGDLNIERDWGWAPEFVDGIYRIMHHSVVDDFVLATGESNKLERFVDIAFSHFGLNWEDCVVSTEEYYRPAEIQKIRGNPSKAKRELGWVARYRLGDIVKDMAGEIVEQSLVGSDESF